MFKISVDMFVCFLNINKIFCSFQQIHKHFAKKFPNLPMNNWIGFHVSTKQSRIFLVLRQSVSADRGSFRVGVHFFSFCLTTMKIISVIKLMLLVSFWLMLCVLSTCFWLIFADFLPKYHIFITIYVWLLKGSLFCWLVLIKHNSLSSNNPKYVSVVLHFAWIQ